MLGLTAKSAFEACSASVAHIPRKYGRNNEAKIFIICNNFQLNISIEQFFILS